MSATGVIRVAPTGSKASPNVRYAFNSNESVRRNEPTPCAMCGRLRVGKSFLQVCSIGRRSHVFGLRCGSHDRWP
jgi:hypothetical protein